MRVPAGAILRVPCAQCRDVLDLFRPATRAWFSSTFDEPTPAQTDGWRAIAAGRHTLIHAPTGQRQDPRGVPLVPRSTDRARCRHSGHDGTPRKPGVRVLYVSPLKALTYDVERNLRAPLAGIALAAARLKEPLVPVAVGIADRRHLRRKTVASSRDARPTS